MHWMYSLMVCIFLPAQELYPGVNYKPNTAHHFLRLLHDEGKLQMVYTQNIDGLERCKRMPFFVSVKAGQRDILLAIY